MYRWGLNSGASCMVCWNLDWDSVLEVSRSISVFAIFCFGKLLRALSRGDSAARVMVTPGISRDNLKLMEMLKAS